LDLETSERAEKQLEAFITRRDTERRKTEGERREEELWRESERYYQAKRHAELVFEWCEFYERQAQRAITNGRRIAAENRVKAAKLLESYNGQEGE
jgi:hypothetical protein